MAHVLFLQVVETGMRHSGSRINRTSAEVLRHDDGGGGASSSEVNALRSQLEVERLERVRQAELAVERARFEQHEMKARLEHQETRARLEAEQAQRMQQLEKDKAVLEARAAADRERAIEAEKGKALEIERLRVDKEKIVLEAS